MSFSVREVQPACSKKGLQRRKNEHRSALENKKHRLSGKRRDGVFLFADLVVRGDAVGADGLAQGAHGFMTGIILIRLKSVH